MELIRQFVAVNAGGAIEMVKSAHELGLAASYAPQGGTDDKHDDPVLHRVIVVGNTMKINGWQTTIRDWVVYD